MRYLLKTTFLLCAIIFTLNLSAQYSSAPCNNFSNWSNHNYTNINSSIIDDVPSGAPVCLGGVNNISRLQDADSTNYATIDFTLGTGLCNATLSTKDTDANDTFARGSWAGYKIGTGGLLGLSVMPSITIETYMNNTLQETENVSSSLLSLDPSLLSASSTTLVGFNTTLPFDEIRITYQTLGVLFSTRVYNAVVVKYCNGPSLACNVSNNMSMPSFPVSIVNPILTGVSLGTINNTENLLTEDANDYTSVTMVASVLSSATIGVSNQLQTYSAGTYAAFEISNPGIASLGLLNNLTVSLYNNGVFQESKSTSNLLLSTSALSGTARSMVGFISSYDYDEVRLTFNQPTGASIGTTRVYNMVVKSFCSGPDLDCNAETTIKEPEFPVVLNMNNTGISGAVCALCAVNNAQNLLDDDNSNYANINLTAGALVSGSIAIQNAIDTFSANTYVGFIVENLGLAKVDLIEGIRITTYRNGVVQENKYGAIDLIGAQTTLLTGFDTMKVGFITTKSYDEVRISLVQTATLNLGTTRIHRFIVENICSEIVRCDENYKLIKPDVPVFINSRRTGVTGVACVGCFVHNTENVLDTSKTNAALIQITAGVLAQASISVEHATATYPAGSQAGFVVEEKNGTLQLDLFNSITISTYLDGVYQESGTGGFLLDLSLLVDWIGSPVGTYKIAMNTTKPFDEVRFSIGSLASALNFVGVYGAFVDTRYSLECYKVNPDINSTFVGLPVVGDVSTNDVLLNGLVYSAEVIANTSNPTSQLPVMQNNGEYIFTGDSAGDYQFDIKIIPNDNPDIKDISNLKITVIDTGILTNKPVIMTDIGYLKNNDSIIINSTLNDTAVNFQKSLVRSTMIIVDPPNKGIAIVHPSSGNISYTPLPTFSGLDSITYRIWDNNPFAQSNNGLQEVTVIPSYRSNSTLGVDDYRFMDKDSTINGNVLMNDIDPENDLQSIVAMKDTIPNKAEIEFFSNGDYQVKGLNGYVGPVSFVYSLMDDATTPDTARATAHFLVLPPSFVALPVKLIYFHAQLENKNGLLTWSTATEINNNKFEVLRRLDSESEFTKIGEVQGAGDSYQITDYFFEDNLENITSGNVYYKLKQIDFNGNFKFSKTQVIQLNNELENKLNIYPNPAVNTIKITNTDQINHTYKLIDIDGKIHLEGNTFNSTIDVSTLPRGFYFLKVLNNEQVIETKSVILTD